VIQQQTLLQGYLFRWLSDGVHQALVEISELYLLSNHLNDFHNL